MSVTTSTAFTTEFGSISFSENCVILPYKIKRCGSTRVSSEENGRKLYLVVFQRECYETKPDALDLENFFHFERNKFY